MDELIDEQGYDIHPRFYYAHGDIITLELQLKIS